jgi:hypothetical protein
VLERWNGDERRSDHRCQEDPEQEEHERDRGDDPRAPGRSRENHQIGSFLVLEVPPT